jgi:hypothetical protein
MTLKAARAPGPKCSSGRPTRTLRTALGKKRALDGWSGEEVRRCINAGARLKEFATFERNRWSSGRCDGPAVAWIVASVVRALQWHPSCRRFDLARLRQAIPSPPRRSSHPKLPRMREELAGARSVTTSLSRGRASAQPQRGGCLCLHSWHTCPGPTSKRTSLLAVRRARCPDGPAPSCRDAERLRSPLGLALRPLPRGGQRMLPFLAKLAAAAKSAPSE